MIRTLHLEHNWMTPDRLVVNVPTAKDSEFWAAMGGVATRATLWVLLPLSLGFAVVLAGLGVVQTLAASASATTLEGASQTISLGPVASQLAIKMLGTNGGGFFNANSAHPYENPTPLSNMIEMLSILLLPGALVMMFGRMLDQPRQARALFVAMLIPLLLGVAICTWAEQQGNPFLIAAGADPAGGNMEGKEVRFGISGSSLFAVITTAASCGAVSSNRSRASKRVRSASPLRAAFSRARATRSSSDSRWYRR